MANLNKVLLLGNLTRDPELRYTPKGTAVADIGVAINRVWNNEQNQRQKEMQAEGATITETQDMGRRKFAYNSDHMESGHYINFQFTAEPSSIEKIKGRLRLNNQIHLQYYQRA